MLHMSPINGIYHHASSDTTLTLTEGDDRTGSFSGTLSRSGIDYPLAYGNFHFKYGSSTGVIAITFSTHIVQGIGQAWVLFSPDQDYSRLRAMGTQAGLAGDIELTGLEFVRKNP
jgi:hypothetical protein